MKKFSKEFAKYYSISIFVGFMMFFVFDFLKKQEILAVLLVSIFTAIGFVLINRNKKNE